MSSIDPVPFKLSISDDILNDLKERVSRTRWPDQLEDIQEGDWSYGVELNYMKSLAEYWANGYDWRKFEDTVNKLEQYTATVNGIDVHFIHQKSSDPKAVPVLLLHGWPGTCYDFIDVIPKLTSNESGQSFHVVCPDLPSFGFSGKPKAKGFDALAVGRVMNALMIKLGYIKYVAAGGDWGSLISRVLACHHAQNCVGIHVNMLVVPPPKDIKNLPSTVMIGLGKGSWVLPKEENEGLERLQTFMKYGSGYLKLQQSYPQTVAYGLSDSPIGLLSWIVEKFYFGTQHSQNFDVVIPKDTILSLVTSFWVTNSMASSIRLYKEEYGRPGGSKIIGEKIEVPVGVAVFPCETFQVPKSWAEAYMNIQHWTHFERGGHFAVYEEPELLAGDIRKCFSEWMEAKLISFE